MCNMDCFNCVRSDCTNNAVSDAERKAQDAYDNESIKERIPEERSSLRKGKLGQYDYLHTTKGKAAQKRYNQSEKGREVKRRYYNTDKGKATLRRYNQSDKGKAAQKRNADKKVASGKNAEYCRRYRERKKAEREAAACKA